MRAPDEPAIDVPAGKDDRPPPTRGQVDDRLSEAMSPEDRAMVLRGLEQARNGDLATEEEARATLARFRI